ncbi:hypothetical protein [Nocardia sp. XZ_19_369]|uniref:hypothetical protein n=1 Tax=Nocardia sp. XZ_19_369 TaxID=2769487 RepID=UPI00188E5781|nr:hypothetical protein [Nocardia sp. XZ_19_369]
MSLESSVEELLIGNRLIYLPDALNGSTELPAREFDHQAAEDSEDAAHALDSVDGLSRAIRARALAIGFAINNTVVLSRSSISLGVEEVVRWIRNEEIVRVVGAGRALLAAAIPANRLAHCGAHVYVAHDVVPLPNTIKGGNILAASASGRSASVLNIMRTARARNPVIRILGIADNDATAFAELCDIFIGIHQQDSPHSNPLQALADTGEYVISELLDAMVVAAAKRVGLTDRNFREGHEDLGDTGPYLPEDR